MHSLLNDSPLVASAKASIVSALAGARCKLRSRFVALLACMMCVCVLGLSFIWEPRLTREMTASQVRNLDQNVEILSDALIPFLLQNQIGAVFETLSSMQGRYQNWETVVLTTPDGAQLYPLSAVVPVAKPDIIQTSRAILFEGKQLAALSVRVDISDDLGQIRRQVRYLTVLIAVFFLGALLVVGVLLERWVVKRAALLASAAQQLARGNYEAKMPPSSNDEIGDLTNSFSTMRATIKENEQNLIASRDEAQAAAEAKSRFLATMSHEIRTPLNGVIPIAELLLEQDLPKEQAQLIETIQESGKALKSIIDDILDITKMDEGKFVLHRDEFSLNSLVQSVIGIFRVSAQNKGISLDFSVPETCPKMVMGDANRLRQVLINLVGNAIKFTSEGGVTLRVTALAVATPRTCTVCFEVSDTGIGISEQDQTHVFERFVQVDNRSNREYQGTGLGLSICNMLVAEMGGKLSVDSREGEGSRFYFSLPFNTVEVEGEIQADLELDPKVASSHHHTPAKPSSVLVVDDSKTNLKIAKVILRSLKHRVTTAESGEIAIDLIQEKQFDLVLMDVNMPGIDGLETTRRIRKRAPHMSHPPIIGLSASAFADDIENCLEAGMNGFLAKPLSKAELATTLSEHLAHACSV
ncbi:ATP-binding protein [Aliiroseovarius sp. PrR006]|uniref:HAMP domain-containing hybrid sensor histidine kinase/response regulator n=1 Tax=Aliiroseovarius sp. PrR006 TaxID=2706883 RepID=UPI0013D60237|nr:ATP-binding protein [Aliiroseovarius sp. PrR006]NDW53813.1 response regulator [Aliiroseovarius sp. PrR006]